MFHLFRRLMPREENFFDMFARHADLIVRGAEELRAMRPAHDAELLLVGSSGLTSRYQVGLQTLGLQARCLGDEATWAGHLALARHL